MNNAMTEAERLQKTAELERLKRELKTAHAAFDAARDPVYPLRRSVPKLRKAYEERAAMFRYKTRLPDSVICGEETEDHAVYRIIATEFQYKERVALSKFSNGNSFESFQKLRVVVERLLDEELQPVLAAEEALQQAEAQAARVQYPTELEAEVMNLDNLLNPVEDPVEDIDDDVSNWRSYYE